MFRLHFRRILAGAVSPLMQDSLKSVRFGGNNYDLVTKELGLKQNIGFYINSECSTAIRSLLSRHYVTAEN